MYPKLTPVELPPNYKQTVTIGENKVRAISSTTSAGVQYIDMYVVPPGKTAILREFYTLDLNAVNDPIAILIRGITPSLKIYARIVGSSALVYGSVNLIQGFPIELLEGESVWHEHHGTFAGSTSTVSILVEEKDKYA